MGEPARFSVRLALVSAIALGGPAAFAQKKPIFFPSVQAPIERGNVGDSYAFSLGFFFSGISPLKNPYAQVDGANAVSFRYQVPSSFGIETSFALMSWLEVGVSAEYAHFSSRFLSTSGSNTRSETINYSALPIIKGIVRGIWNLADGFAFETEIGGGYGRGTATVSSSDSAAAKVKNTISSFVGHAAVGVGMMWDEGYSIHTFLGYGLHTLGDNRYTSSPYDVIQDGDFSGPFGKVMIRYQF